MVIDGYLHYNMRLIVDIMTDVGWMLNLGNLLFLYENIVK